MYLDLIMMILRTWPTAGAWSGGDESSEPRAVVLAGVSRVGKSILTNARINRRFKKFEINS